MLLIIAPSIVSVGIAEVDEYVGDCDLALLNSCISINIFCLGMLLTPQSSQKPTAKRHTLTQVMDTDRRDRSLRRMSITS